jgi:two-component system LytT family response regulator
MKTVICGVGSIVHMDDSPQKIISKTLKEFEELLQPFGFFRPHNSFVINLSQVTEYVKADGGYLLMKNKMKVPVSKNKKDQLLSLLAV